MGGGPRAAPLTGWVPVPLCQVAARLPPPPSSKISHSNLKTSAFSVLLIQLVSFQHLKQQFRIVMQTSLRSWRCSYNILKCFQFSQQIFLYYFSMKILNFHFFSTAALPRKCQFSYLNVNRNIRHSWGCNLKAEHFVIFLFLWFTIISC